MKDNFHTRPIVMGTKGGVVSGHYLATNAGLRILEHGGNAIDAGAAVCFCLNVLEPQANGTGGECPTLIYSSKEKTVYAVSGMGYSPEKLTLKWCKENDIDMIPGDGYIPACVPSVVGTWITALIKFGKLSLSEILQPAIELARYGFPVYDDLHKSIKENYKNFLKNYPSTARIYCPYGKIPETGEVLKNPDLAEVYELLVKTEKKYLKKGRTQALTAAVNEFYKGSIAKKIVNFIKENPVIDSTGKKHTGLLSYNDFKNWHATIEEPVKFNFPNYLT